MGVSECSFCVFESRLNVLRSVRSLLFCPIFLGMYAKVFFCFQSMCLVKSLLFCSVFLGV